MLFKSYCLRACMVAVCLLQSACSLFSPVPLWELTKASASAAKSSIASSPSKPKDTIYHIHPTFTNVCIEFNPQSQSMDILPALQAEFRSHQIESRIYEAGTSLSSCEIWLNYVAHVEWDVSSSTNDYKTYLTSATFTLRTSTGKVLSKSSYLLEPSFGTDKWAPTRSKISLVVTALLTGFEN